MTLQDFASRLKKAQPKTVLGRPGYRACCPAHDDANPSFCVWEGDDGWLHVQCPKCSEDEILRSMGLAMEDRRVSERSNASPDTVYVYHGGDGKPVMRKRRYVKDGKKSFTLDRYDGKDFVSGLQGLNGQRFLLYNLPAVRKAAASGSTIYVNEGEKACEAFRRKGLVATCQPFGADKDRPQSKWLPEYTNEFKGATVVVVADRDETGIAYGGYVAGELTRIAASVTLVHSKTEGDKDDAWDHLNAGHDPTDFVPIKGESRPTVFKFVDADELDVMPQKPMLLDGLLGVQDRAMIFGPPESAKTLIIIELLLACSVGGLFAGQFTALRPMNVAYCTNEGRYGFPARFRAGLVNNSLSIKDVHGRFLTVFSIPQIFDSSSDRALRVFADEWEALGRGPLDVFVLDTLNKASLGSEESSNDDAARGCDNLARVNERLGCASILSHHNARNANTPRGASAYEGDLDLILRSQYDKNTHLGELSLYKGKDIPQFEEIAYKVRALDDSAAISWLGSAGFASSLASTIGQVVLAMKLGDRETWGLDHLDDEIPNLTYEAIRHACYREEAKPNGLIIRSSERPILYALREKR